MKDLSKEDHILQQVKVDLKNSYLLQEKRRLYLEYLKEDRSVWPDVQETEEKLKVSREERTKVKAQLEEEKDKVYDILQKVKDEHDLLQEKVKKLEEKLQIFENKKKLFESRRKIDPESVDSAIAKCEQAIVKMEAEICKQTAELEKRENEISRMKTELSGRSKSSDAKEQNVERLEKVVKFLQNMTGVKVHIIGPDKITLAFAHHNPELNSVTSQEESLNLEMTLTFITGCHGDVKLSDVKVHFGRKVNISVDHFQISDIVDTAIAMNDVPFLVLSVLERWNQHFPLLSEMDILNKNHAIDWIQEQCRLRVLVDRCGKIMFTLSVPKDYPSTRGITLLDSYGIDNVETEDLPNKDSTLLQWVIYLEKKYGDC